MVNGYLAKSLRLKTVQTIGRLSIIKKLYVAKNKLIATKISPDEIIITISIPISSAPQTRRFGIAVQRMITPMNSWPKPS